MKPQKTPYEMVHSRGNRFWHWVLTRMFGFIYWPLFIKYLDWIHKNEEKLITLIRKQRPDLGQLYDMDKAIKTKMESSKPTASETTQKANEALDHWLSLMNVLNAELQAGKMTAQEVADVLTQTPQHRQALLKKNERFASYFNENHPELGLAEAQNFIDAELERIIEEQKKSASSKNTEETAALAEMFAQTENSPIKKVISSIEDRLKAQKKAKEMAEQEKKYKEHLKMLAAINPEMLEGIGADSFQTAKEKELNKEKILKKEQVVLRKKLSEKATLDKSMKEIGSEKQKAMEEIKKDLGSNISGSI